MDAVANVAGIGDFSGDITETTPDEWNRVLGVNLTGMYHVSRSAIPHLRAAGGGAIVNISSQFGLVGCLASPAYCASKAGVVGLTKAMAIDHAGENIRVNAISAGPVRTLAARSIAGFPTMESIVEERSPLHRPIDADDVGAAGAYLLSDAAKNVTATTLYVDAAYHAMGM